MGSMGLLNMLHELEAGGGKCISWSWTASLDLNFQQDSEHRPKIFRVMEWDALRILG